MEDDTRPITTIAKYTPKQSRGNLALDQTRGYVLLTDPNSSVEACLEDERLAVLQLPEHCDIEEVYRRADAVVIPGGADVDPALYGADRHATTWPSKARDAIEHLVAQWALRDDKPILGICRGHQMLNVAGGGTLIQDIDSLIPGSGEHGTSHHDITVTGMLRDICRSHGETVNSLHHQCVDHRATGFQVEAWAPDGVIEAIRSNEHRFAMGVQFHPEMMATYHDSSYFLLAHFADCVRDVFSERSKRSRKRSRAEYLRQANLPRFPHWDAAEWDWDEDDYEGYNCDAETKRWEEMTQSEYSYPSSKLPPMTGMMSDTDRARLLAVVAQDAVRYGDYESWEEAASKYEDLTGKLLEVDWEQWGVATDKKGGPAKTRDIGPEWKDLV